MKQQVRFAALQKRKSLRYEEVHMKSNRICESIQPYLKGCVALYQAYGNEVDVSSLITKLQRHHRVVLPVAYADASMKFFEVDEETKYEKSTLGMYEPCGGREVLPHEIDTIVIPLVAFDEQCNRLGHGKGYYDRYLKTCCAVCIGVGFECQKVDNVYPQPHDIALTMIISESKIYVKA